MRRVHIRFYRSDDWNKYDDRLMKAVERGEVDKVATVLGKKGIIPTKLDVEGRSAFHLAATQGQLECLNLMLGHNVDVTAKDASGKSALHMASKYGNSLCVQKLLQVKCISLFTYKGEEEKAQCYLLFMCFLLH
uniref:Uveal autoantigen with coiled-coil domains and ankyrin repeats b n=1 Tax=Xiphophorus couchianus TaxID=32473 RepID=A0A3B5MJL3_9TELE